MGHAYCISLQRRLGIALVAPTSMNAIDQLTQYNELGVADQVSSGKNRSESVRIPSNRSGLLTSTPTACFSVNDGLVGQTLLAVQSCHARRRYSWPFTKNAQAAPLLAAGGNEGLWQGAQCPLPKAGCGCTMVLWSSDVHPMPSTIRCTTWSGRPSTDVMCCKVRCSNE